MLGITASVLNVFTLSVDQICMSLYRDIIGIYVDDSVCQAVYVYDGDIFELLDGFNSPVLPSIVTILPDHIYVANSSLQTQFPKNTISRCFRLLGRSLSSQELALENLQSCVPLELRANGKIVYHIENAEKQDWPVEDVVCTILRYLVESCEKRIEIQVHCCILMIPDDFNDKQIASYKAIAEKAGIRVESCMRRSVCVGYSLLNACVTFRDSGFEICKLVMYQLCDSSLICSVINLEDGTPCFMADIVDNSISLDLFVQEVESTFCRMFFLKYDVDLYSSNEGSDARMKEVVRVRKNIRDWLLLINDVEEISIEIPSSTRRVLRRKKLQAEEYLTLEKTDVAKALRRLIEKIASQVQLVVQKAGLSLDNIYKIVPIGLNSNMCLIQNYMESQFGESIFDPGYISIAKGIGYYILHHMFLVCFPILLAELDGLF